MSESQVHEEEGGESWSGFRPFTVPSALDGAMSLLRRDVWTYLGLSLLGIGPLTALMLGLEYVGTTRRLFRTTYAYDWVLYVVAAVVPLLVIWKGICGAAQARTTLEWLRREALEGREREVLPPVSMGVMLREALREWSSVLVAELARDVVVWLPWGLLALLIGTVDASMETWVRVMLLVTYGALGVPVLLFVSALTMMWMPKAAAGPAGRRTLPGTLTRSFGLSALMGLMAVLLFLNLHLAVGLTLYLMDALFAVDVSYWSRFFSLSHRLYLFGLVGLTLVLAEPIFRSGSTLIWVDAMVRRDAVDIAGRIGRLGSAPRVGAGAAVVHNPSKEGDRSRVSGAVSALMAVVAASAVLLGGADVSAQTNGQEPPVMVVEGGDGGVTSEELRSARQLLAEGDGGTWVDTWQLREYVRERREVADTESERRYWEEIDGQIQTVDGTWGDERAREVRRLRARLDGPRLIERGPGGEGSDVEAVVSGERVRSELEALLEEDAYRDLAASEVERGGLDLDFEGRRRRPRDLERDWGCDREGYGSPMPQNDGVELPDVSVPPGLFKILAAVLLMAALGMVIFALVRRWSERRQEGEAQGEGVPVLADIAAQEPGREDVLAFGFGDWHLRAEELARQGQYRLAIRCLYLSLLVTLNDRALIAYDPNLTNWEYEMTLRRNLLGQPGGPLLSAFGEVTRQFELVWYGEYEADAGRYGECERHLGAIASSPVLRATGGEEGS